MWVLTQQWTRTRRTSWMRMKTAGKYLNNIRIIDHGSRCQTKVAMINCEKCVALAPTRRTSCWTAPLTCRASWSSTVTLGRQTTGRRVSSLFKCLCSKLHWSPQPCFRYIFNKSLLVRTPLGSLASGSIFKTPNSGADMFAEESDIEATPRAKSPVPRIQVSISEHYMKIIGK